MSEEKTTQPAAQQNSKSFFRKHFVSRMDAIPGFTKVIFILSTLSLILLVCGYLIWNRHGLMVGFIVALMVNSLVFYYSVRLSDLFYGNEILGRDAWDLGRDLKALSDKLEIDPPHLKLVEVATPLIFSCGLFSGQYHLLISTGLLRKFDLAERRALLAFELTKLKMHLTASITAASALASLFQLAGSLLDLTLFLPLYLITSRRVRLGKSRPLRLGLAIVAPVIGLINRLSLSRGRVLELDRKACEALSVFSANGDVRQSLASALFKLESFSQTRPVDIRLCDTPLFAVNPLTEFDVSPYFLVHPPLEARLKLLIGRSTL